MNDFAQSGATPSAAPSTEVPINSGESAPQSLGTQTPVAEKPPEAPKPEAKEAPKAPVSVREAVKNAHEQVKAKEAEAQKAKEPPKPAAEPQKAPEKAAEPTPKPEATRDESGRFQPSQAKPAEQPQATKYEPPARFNQQAKTDWANAPDSVKAEVLRATRELEEGHTKYKESAERYERLREYDDTAKANGRDLKDSISKIVEFERTMKTNPLAAIDYALREAGPKKQDGSPLTLNDIVSHVSGQATEPRLQAAQARIHELETRLSQKEQEAKLPSIVEEFRAQNPRFDELSDVIAVLIEAGTAHDLPTAYKLANTLRPASQATTPHSPAPQEQNALAQTQASPPRPANPAGLKSVSGSPSTGSDPAEDRSQVALKDTPSIKDALRRARAKAS